MKKQFLSTALVMSLLGATSTSTALAEESGSLIKQTKITCEQAETIALEKFPGSFVEEIQLDRDDQPLAWEIKMVSEKIWNVEVLVDATSGNILKTEKKKKRW